MLLRQYARGLCTTERFDLPITQTDLGEACGITPVHANRMVGELREEGICTFSNGVVTVTDFEGLLRAGQCSWDYLFLPAEIEGQLKQRLRSRAGRGPAKGLAGHRAF